ncbi:histone deacetylase [bacterium]|nr:histone deacetylase [bacterium]
MGVSLIYSPRYLLHNKGIEHPESSQRLAFLVKGLQNSPFARELKWLDPMYVEEDALLRVHTKSYVNLIRTIAFMGGNWIDADTFVSAVSYDIALLAVGGAIKAIENAWRLQEHSFALVRPPGHHASRDRGAGFCLFNNIACAIRYAQELLGLKKVLIVDWDLHHGDGTQNIFYEDPNVLYFSTHQYPWYPGTGKIVEIGEGEGKGYTVNVPLPAGCGDDEYIMVFEELLPSLAKRFAPQLIAVSAGFDAHFADPLGGMFLSPYGFSRIARLVRKINDEFCIGGVFLVLEGGYHPEGLLASVQAVIGELLEVDQHLQKMEREADESIRSQVKKIISEVKSVHSLA